MGYQNKNEVITNASLGKTGEKTFTKDGKCKNVVRFLPL